MKKFLFFLLSCITMVSYAQPSNNDCSGAIIVPTNTDIICDTNIEASFIEATISNIGSVCVNADDYYDVWFEFTATAERHRVIYNVISGNSVNTKFALYEGDCDNITFVGCLPPTNTIENLTIGQAYKLRVYGESNESEQNTTFSLCINTPLPNIAVSSTIYTPEELISNILVSSTCFEVSNIEYSSGITENPGIAGLGYFNQNGSNFMFENGIVLSSGNINIAPGPAVGPTSSDNSGPSGDDELSEILNANGNSGSVNNVAYIEFDFIPMIEHINFDFIFASNEYGIYQCGFADAFGFLLTNLTTGETTNLAVIPDTEIPVSVVTIRDMLYNTACPSQNPEYFDAFYTAQDPTAPVNFIGTTVPMTAESAVIPGNPYHIKLVIADYNDTAFDSAVFIQAGDFNIGAPEYASLTSESGSILCEGESTTLHIDIDETFDITWSHNGIIIPNETDNSIIVTEPGEYTVNVLIPNTECILDYSINIQGTDISGTSLNLSDYIVFEPNSDGIYTFDLMPKVDEVINQIGINESFSTGVLFYTTLEDAISGVNDISFYYTNIENPQTIYVRVENYSTGCFTTSDFRLIVLDENYTTPAPQGEETQSYEEGNTLADIEIEGENIQWYENDVTGGRSAQQTEDTETPLPLETLLTNGTTYYASQTIYDIESETRLAVTVYLSLPFSLGTPDNLSTCTPIETGLGEFNLTLNNENILQELNPELYTVTYYNEYPITDTTDEISTPENYISIENTQTIGVRVTENLNPENFTETSFILVTNPTPPQADVNDIVIDDTDNDGTVIVDLTITAQEILSGQPEEDNIITYHETANAAENGNSIITAPEEYTTTSQTIYYRIENNEECFTTGDFNIIVNTTASTQESNKNNINIYPNPVKEILYISNSSQIINISIYNILGQKVIEQNSNTNNTQLNIQRLTEGVYMVKIKSLEGDKLFKIIKQ